MAKFDYIFIPCNCTLNKCNENIDDLIWKTWDLEQNNKIYRLNENNNIFELEKYHPQTKTWNKTQLSQSVTIDTVVHNRIYKYRLNISNGKLQNSTIKNIIIV